MDVNAITGQIIDTAIKVHRTLGPGLLESAYEVCLAHELRLRGVLVDTQVELPVTYEGIHLNAGYRIDMLVEKLVIVELKAVEKVHPIFEAQLISYLRLSNLQVGLLINFHAAKLVDGLKRIVNKFEEP